jgi:hypothetical protein
MENIWSRRKETRITSEFVDDLWVPLMTVIKSISNRSPSQIVILIVFWQKQKKPSPVVFHHKWSLFIPCSRKETLRAHICMLVSVTQPSVLKEVEGHVGENDLRKLCPRPAADGFGSHAASATRGSPGGAGLTEILMLLELCEFCCAGAAYLSGAGLRR